MNPSIRRALAKGFTLIELLIVVIIIAILAAIAIPQFSNTSSDAQEAALDANLSTMRSAIELYRVQHNNKYPGAAATKGTSTCPTADQGTSEATDDASRAIAFKESLTFVSNAAGLTCKTNPANGPFIYGPYLRAIPKEPVTPSDAIVATNAASTPPTGTTGGWRFNTVSGELVMNSNAKARDEREYYKH